jgi:hypothetical protein
VVHEVGVVQVEVETAPPESSPRTNQPGGSAPARRNAALITRRMPARRPACLSHAYWRPEADAHRRL